jgi:hypothetical protein
MFQKKKGKSSPPPTVRRLAGQSLRERSQQLLDDHLIPIVFGPMMLWMLVLGVWIGSTSKSPSLRFWISSAVVATGVSVIAFLRLIPKSRALARGERGELVVAEQLEALRVNGFRCFHDIVRDGFNIDHVVVGPPGVFVLETKFRSGSGLVEFRNGQGIFVDGREEERDPLKQARGNARVVHDLIRQHAGLELWVKPLVVFVGDWKVKNAWRDTDIRVITANGIARYFDRQDQPELTKREIQLICSHLNRTARVA